MEDAVAAKCASVILSIVIIPWQPWSKAESEFYHVSVFTDNLPDSASTETNGRFSH